MIKEVSASYVFFLILTLVSIRTFFQFFLMSNRQTKFFQCFQLYLVLKINFIKFRNNYIEKYYFTFNSQLLFISWTVLILSSLYFIHQVYIAFIILWPALYFFLFYCYWKHSEHRIKTSIVRNISNRHKNRIV